MRSELFRLNGAVERDPAIDAWMKEHRGELGEIAHEWFEVMRRCGDEVRELMHDGCPVACLGDAAFGYVNVFTSHVNVGFFQGRRADGSGTVVARRRQIYAAREAESGRGDRWRCAQEADRGGLPGHQGAGGERIARMSSMKGRVARPAVLAAFTRTSRR